MPPPLDLTGKRFGALLVVRRERAGPRGGYWRCRCDCGAEEVFPAWRLPHCATNSARHDVATACSTCMHTRECAACGKPFVSRHGKVCCSETCRRLHRQRISLRCYHETRKVADPDINRRRHRKHREKLEADPEAMRVWKEREAMRYRQRQADPVRREQMTAAARRRYAERAQAIQAARRERLAAMSPESRAAWMAERRRYNAAWRRDKLAALRLNDPAAYQRLLDGTKAYRRNQALREILAVAAELEKRSRK